MNFDWAEVALTSVVFHLLKLVNDSSQCRKGTNQTTFTQ